MWQATPRGKSSHHEVIEYSLLQRQGLFLVAQYWWQHWEQQGSRYASAEDLEPGDETDAISEHPTDHPMEILE